MKKRKTYEISVIDKTYSKIISDETKFYTSDTALELGFELKETEYNFESAEIVLLNVDDRSLATRKVSKTNDGFVYEIDDDVTSHYGEWRGQLMLVENGEVHVSSPIKFRIENDLYCNKPLEITEVVSWVSLKRYADSLIDELKQAVLDVEGMDDTFNANELERQATFENNEASRFETFNTNEATRQSNETTRQQGESGRIEAEKQREGTVSKIENRQDTVESKFDLLQQEMTGKDVISAPEIIAARNGEADLKTRLDEEHREVTAQLAENTKFNMQSDFVSQISRLIGGYEKMYYKRENSVNWMTVMLRNGNEHVSWTFRNNTNDDFIILGDCFYGDITSALAMNENIIYSIVSGNFTTVGTSHYATEVGAKIRNEFTGSKIDFQSYRDNRGGIWEFVVDGDTNNKKIHSTYSTSAGQSGYITLFEGLSEGSHVIEGTFLGDDPNNPPSGGAGTSRGWINYGSTELSRTYRTYKTQLTNNRIQNLLFGGSNKEFAFRTRKAGTSHAYQFIPMHSGIGTAFKKVEPRFIADDKVIDYANLSFAEFFECNTFRLVQSVYGRNPESGDENLVEINTNVSINKNGNVEIAGKMKPLTDIEIENGYGIMFPVRKEITTKSISSKGNEYPTIKTDYSSTFMPSESDTTTSFAFVSEENPDFIASIRFNDIRNTLRAGINKGATPFWIEHRDSTLQKLYFRPFYNAELTPNDEFKFSATFNCGKVNGIYDIT